MKVILEDGFAIAVRAAERCAAIRVHAELPKLESFGGNFALILLEEGDLVEKPVGAALLGDVLRSFRVQNVPYQGVAIPGFRAGEMPKIRLGECVRHDGDLSLRSNRLD